MREIVLDTETTGLDPADGHRVLEIGAVEIVHQSLTGKVFHTLINPERDVPQDAVRVHGHSSAALKDKPVFASIVDDFLAFIGDSKLVIHNAEFDVRFVNAELARLGLATIGMDRVVDTLALARKKHPGHRTASTLFATATASTARGGFATARCLDAEILVEVYCELIGRSSAVAPVGRRAGRSRRARCRGCSPLQPDGPEDISRSSTPKRTHTFNILKVSVATRFGFAICLSRRDFAAAKDQAVCCCN